MDDELRKKIDGQPQIYEGEIGKSHGSTRGIIVSDEQICMILEELAKVTKNTAKILRLLGEGCELTPDDQGE